MKKFIIQLLFIFFSFGGYSQIISPFTVQYQTSVKGGIRYLANASIGCSADPNNTGTSACTSGTDQVPPAGNWQDNSFNAAYIDIDGDPTTFQSSSDSISLTLCSEILWAGLFWGGSTSGTAPSGYQNVKFKINDGSYTTLTASSSQTNSVGFNTFHCFTEVTSLLASQGGDFRVTVADIPSNRIGQSNQFGGWTIAIVFKNDLFTMRQLTVFKGLANVSGTSTVDIPVSGFLTPPVGPVSLEVGLMVHDGDRGLTGDGCSFSGMNQTPASTFVPLSDAVNAPTNFFNSTIAYNGVLTPFRIPNMNNTAGIDADIIIPDNSSKNFIGNSATNFTFRQTTTSETYLTQMVSTAIDIYEPDVRSSVKVIDLNGGSVQPGDTLEYTVKGINIGSDPSLNTFLTDTLEPNAIYVANSINIIYGPNSGPKTDAPSDDQAEYNASNHTIKVRIGTGANSSIGGQVNNSPSGLDSTLFTFRVTATEDCIALACDNIIDNRAYIYGTGPTSGNIIVSGSNPGIFDINGCPVPGSTKTPIPAPICNLPNDTVFNPGYCSGIPFSVLPYPGYSFFNSSFAPVTTPAVAGVYYAIKTSYSGCDDTVKITINAIINCNTPPSQGNETLSGISEDQLTPTTSVDLTANNVDPDGTTVTVTAVVSSTGGGTITISGGGTTIDYTPAPNFNGIDTVIYTICDAGTPTPIICLNDTLFVSVSAVNDAPSQGNESMGPIVEDTPGAVTSPNLVANNIDPDGTSTVITTIVSSPNGTATISGAGTTIDFIPNPNFFGTALVIYTVCDGGIPLPAACVNDTLFVTVSPLNDAPAQGNEIWTINEDSPVTTSPDLTNNNIDPDGTTITISTVVSTTGGGTVTINAGDTTVNYTPAPNFTGVDTVIYTVCDNGTPLPAICVNDTLFVTVSPVNDAPSQGNESMAGVTEDQGIPTTSPDLTNNNIDPDGTTTIVTTIVSTTGGGTVTINAGDTTVNYTPAPNFNGIDTVIYTVCDGGNPLPAACVNDTLFVTVSAVNDAPSQGNETMTVGEDTPTATLSPNLTNNNIDVDGTNTTVTTIVSTTGGGTVTINAGDTTVNYTPAPNFTGVDTVIYTVCDNGTPLPAICVNDTLFVTVSPVNDAPSQGNETMGPIVEDETVPTISPDLTNNNIDPDGTTTTVTAIVSTTGGGTVTINTGDTTISYTPAPNFNGIDTVIYTVCDGGNPPPAACVNDTLFVTVSAVNDAPSQGNETMSVGEDTPTSTTSPDLTNNNIDVDGTNTTVTTIVSTTGGGTVTINAGDTTVNYTPAPNFTGIDTVIYTVCDNGTPLPAICVNDTLFVTVSPVNDAPSQGNESMAGVTEDQGIPTTSPDLTNNNIDPDGTTTTVTAIVSTTGGGTVTINAGDTTISYTPAPNFNGIDTVIYTVCDGGNPPPAACVNDTLFVTVSPVNDAPSQGNEWMGPITEDNTTATSSPNLTANNIDIDGTTTTVTTIVSTTGGGTVVITGGGTTIDYTPALNFNGVDTVIYTVCDNGTPLPAICVNDTLFVTVTPVNDPPSQGNEVMGPIVEDTPTGTTSPDLTNNNIDPDGTATIVTTIVSTTGGGTVTINPGDTTINYIPALNFNGIDTVIYTVCDGGIPLPVACVNDTLFVTVTPVNDTMSQGNETLGGILEDQSGATTSGDLTLNNIDPDGTATIVTTIVSTTGGGTVTINPGGTTVNYTPAPNFNGIDTVIYTICDGGTPLPVICVNDTLFVTVDPQVDTDGDGVSDDVEILNGTDPNDPCSLILANQNMTPQLSFLDGDCDGDGVTNGLEIDPDGNGIPGPNGTNFQDSCDYNPADQVFANVNASYLTADCDGDGVPNGLEIDPDGDGNAGPNATNPQDPCDFNIADQVFANVSAAFLAADCDGDGVTNGLEIDPDGNGTPGPNGTNPQDPCDFNIADQVFANVSAAFLADDCDGDGVTNGDEIDPDGDGNAGPNTTNPQDPCDFNIADQVFANVSAAFLAADCDGDGVTNGDEIDPDGDGIAGPNATNPQDPCDFDIAYQVFANVSAAFLVADCDGDGVSNGLEIDPDEDGIAGPNGTNPQDPCDFHENDQVIANVAIPFLDVDCDGDGVTNGDEINDGTNPYDPCDLILSSQTLPPAIEWNLADCDGDGINNGDEVNGGSDPFDPCSPRPCDLEVPQAFTPDGDGINDYLVIEGITKYPGNTLVIFNRWGNIVYDTKDYQNDWGGTTNAKLVVGGDELPTGTYYYVLDCKDTSIGENGIFKGYIYIQR
jgi:gliding motility-associated-like protein